MAAADPVAPGTFWYAVRCVFQWADDVGAPYEERLTLWRAGSMEEAISRAEAEAWRYAEENDHRYLELAQCHRLDVDGRPGDGDEVFSLLRDSLLDARSYLDRHFDTGGEHQGSTETTETAETAETTETAETAETTAATGEG
ncbi:hypothetical protein ABT144_23270 [Streptomyces sp. NPDC002039]|uniref:hypothetical protein n=1 Tax=Streptomyces sp. NPDC002039 TaxID=3154660 RepID=UPI00331E472C